MKHLSKVLIRGYKSICNQEIDFHSINILIGTNGAGKSNLISFFEMLKRIGKYEFQNYVMEQGGANKILYNGRKITNDCYFAIQREPYMFYARLNPTDMDSMYLSQQGLYDYIKKSNFYAADGFLELKDHGLLFDFQILHSIGIYHFQDTGTNSSMKTFCDMNDNLELASDGRNIAAVLYRIFKTDKNAYERIVKLVRMAAPDFWDFILRENPLNQGRIRLEWQKKGCDIPFGAEQLSDGTLRFICLAVLLLQPEDMRKDIMFLDEPELGLHPAAVTLITELIKKYAADAQIIAATQSVEFMNEFKTDDIIVVENKRGETVFQRLEETDLEDWLEDYSLGELWKKNIIGGRP